MKNQKKLLLPFVAACLASCGKATTTVERKQISYAENPQPVGAFSIGLGESKVIPISKSISWDIFEREPSLSKNDVSFSVETNIEQEGVIDCTLSYGVGYESDLFRHVFYSAFKVTCSHEFDGEIKISKGYIETESSVYSFDLDLSLLFNDDYVHYPPFVPSYVESSFGGFMNRWSIQTFFDDYLVLDFEWFYNLGKYSKNTIAINNISFSDNLKEYLGDVSLLIIDKKNPDEAETYEMIFHNKFEENGYTFEPFRRVDYTAECSDKKIVIYKLDFKKERDYKAYSAIFGDVIYDVTINGGDYSIKDIFYV